MSNIEKVYFFKASIADKSIEIECHHKAVFKQCRCYLSDFEKPDLVIKVSEKEMIEEASLLPPIEESYEGVATSRSYGQIENKIVQRKIAEGLVPFDTFLMHGATIAYKNHAYMFTAPSDTGKTTRCKLWKNIYSDSVVICDDKPFIQIKDSQAFACGSPWCGKEGMNTNIIVPLRAIFLLERAGEGEQSLVEEVSLGKAFTFLLQQTYRPESPDLMRKTIQLLKSLEGKVKIYRFHSTPTDESVRLAYETARAK